MANLVERKNTVTAFVRSIIRRRSIKNQKGKTIIEEMQIIENDVCILLEFEILIRLLVDFYITLVYLASVLQCQLHSLDTRYRIRR